MPSSPPVASGARTPLTAERVAAGAVRLADRIGMEAFTIRRLADELDVKPMTIYHHVPGKEAIIDGMVDQIFAEIGPPPPQDDWRSAMRERSHSMREVLRKHSWAPPYMESRTNPGPATLANHEAVLACLRSGGLSWELTAHAAAVIDSYLYGFALQEAHLPFGGSEQIGELAESIVEEMPADAYPTMVDFTRSHVLQPGYSFGASFDFGLDLLLDGIEAAARR